MHMPVFTITVKHFSIDKKKLTLNAYFLMIKQAYRGCIMCCVTSGIWSFGIIVYHKEVLTST